MTIEQAMNPTIGEAIQRLEGMIFTADFSPNTLRAIAVNKLALAALREQAEREKGCEYCETPGKTLHVVECAEPRIMLHVSGRYVQMYDEEYPGWVDNFPIHFCPMCGRKLERNDT